VVRDYAYSPEFDGDTPSAQGAGAQLLFAVRMLAAGRVNLAVEDERGALQPAARAAGCVMG
jgi:polar amino acid transport system substrate-binding protein